MSVRSEFQESSVELHLARDHIMGEMKREQPDTFLFLFMQAFIRTDRDNFDLLRPVAMKLANKYEIVCTCQPGDPDTLTAESWKYCRGCQTRNPSSEDWCISCGLMNYWSGLPL